MGVDIRVFIVGFPISREIGGEFYYICGMGDYYNKIQESNNWYRKKAKEFQRELVAKSTPYERIFFQILASSEFGDEFKFQKVILWGDERRIKKFYIVDFYIPSKRLIIEIDGNHHKEDSGVVKYDKVRDKILSALGYRIIRFTNDEVYTQRDGLLDIIRKII
jgi:very-short-patch-repair endonuclease